MAGSTKVEAEGDAGGGSGEGTLADGAEVGDGFGAPGWSPSATVGIVIEAINRAAMNFFMLFPWFV